MGNYWTAPAAAATVVDVPGHVPVAAYVLVNDVDHAAFVADPDGQRGTVAQMKLYRTPLSDAARADIRKRVCDVVAADCVDARGLRPGPARVARFRLFRCSVSGPLTRTADGTIESTALDVHAAVDVSDQAEYQAITDGVHVGRPLHQPTWAVLCQVLDGRLVLRVVLDGSACGGYASTAAGDWVAMDLDGRCDATDIARAAAWSPAMRVALVGVADACIKRAKFERNVAALSAEQAALEMQLARLRASTPSRHPTNPQPTDGVQ
jgi:hypothetical protein